MPKEVQLQRPPRALPAVANGNRKNPVTQVVSNAARSSASPVTMVPPRDDDVFAPSLLSRAGLANVGDRRSADASSARVVEPLDIRGPPHPRAASSGGQGGQRGSGTGGASPSSLGNRSQKGTPLSRSASGRLSAGSGDASGNDEAYRRFQEIDEDKNGFLDASETEKLAKKLNLKRFTKLKMREAFPSMAPGGSKLVSFTEFNKWFQLNKENVRRKDRSQIRWLFEKLDSDSNGGLDKTEIARLFRDSCRHSKQLASLDPPFDLETDWPAMDKTADTNGDLQVTFDAFENWWKERCGIENPNIPVLPEYFVMLAHEISEKEKYETSANQDGQRTGKQLWAYLRPRLRMLVQMAKNWGEISELYTSHAHSLHQDRVLRKCTRHPDSSFSAVWDLSSILFLVYVSVSVPLRACFEMEVSLGSFEFFIDNIVDMYFIVDVVLNFRTAYREDANGYLEDRPRNIAKNYLSGWFSVDVVSCIPVQYIELMTSPGDDDQGSNRFKAIKVIRLIRLSKMLRLARIKRIMTKYEERWNFNQNLTIFSLMAVILFTAHMLACFWYLAGSSSQELPNGVTLEGWVAEEPWSHNATANEQVVSIGTKYITSMYYAFNSLDQGQRTDGEKLCGLVAMLASGLIYGSLAGLMSNLLATTEEGKSVGIKLKALRTWLDDRRIPKESKSKIVKYFLNLWSRSAINDSEIMQAMPPAMAVEVCRLAYQSVLQSVPMFRDLSPDILSQLCLSVCPLFAVKDQQIISEGDAGNELYLLMSGEVEVSKNGASLSRHLAYFIRGSPY
jgi:Ca2+-binding EF-hand superfamily protein